MIDKNTIDRIMAAARIEEVVGEFVNLRKRGANYMGLCPFHDERTPSFSVSPARGICKCFSCGEGGNVVHFIMKHEQLSYHDALKWLAKRYHIEVVEKELSPEEQRLRTERDSMFVVNEFARDWFAHHMTDTDEGRQVGLAYFHSRGLRDETIAKFQLGFSGSRRDGFSMEALRKGYRRDLLVKTGLSIESGNGALADRYRDRVIFPVHTVSGKVVAFGGRILKKVENVGKYINSPQSEIYNKSAELYGLYFAKQSIMKLGRCYMVEGYLDVISMHQAGLCNVVASSGTSLTKEQTKLLHRFTENVTLLYDGDPAGIKAALRGVGLLLEEGINVRVLLLPDGEDPDSFAQSHSAAEFTEYIKANETDFIRFKTRILLNECADDPIQRARVIQEVLGDIALIPDELIRSEYIKECSRMMNQSEDRLFKQLDKTRAELWERRRKQRELDQRYGRHEQTYSQPGAGSVGSTPFAAGGAGYSNRGGAGYSGPGGADYPKPVSTDYAGQGDAPRGANDTSTGQAGQGPAPSFEPGTLPEMPPETTPAATPSPKVSYPFEPYEKNLLQMVVRYGERPLFTDEEGRTVSVLDYIHADMENDEIGFSVPLYRQMMDDALQHCREEGFVAERHFLQHPSPEMSLLAAELVTDRYELSRLFTQEKTEAEKKQQKSNDGNTFLQKVKKEEEMLDIMVPRLLEDLKYQIVKEQVRRAKDGIRQAQQQNDSEALQRCMKEYRDLLEIEKTFAKALGERIITFG